MEDLSARQVLIQLLAQDAIDDKKIWSKECLKAFVQAMDEQSHIEQITLHEAWQRNSHVPEILSARLSDELEVQKDFEELYAYVKDQVERTSVLNKGTYSEQSDREQDAIVEHIVEGIDIEIETAGFEKARAREAATAVVRPNTPVNADARKLQVIDTSALSGRDVSGH